MISFNSKRTIDILLGSIPELREEWSDKSPFLMLTQENGENYKIDKYHDVVFKETGFKSDLDINILFSHFPLLKYELEAIEMPLYASKVFPNAKIQTWYYDSRQRMSTQKSYINDVKNGTSTSPNSDFLKSFDLMITRSSTIRRMTSEIPDVLRSCKYKVNIQTNNHKGNIGIGEDYSFCYTDFFSPAGRKFSDRALNNMTKNNFSKKRIIAFVGSVCWWKGQAEWLENIDPALLKDYVVLMLGDAKDAGYLKRIENAAISKNISLLFSDYVNPDFLCDVLCHAHVSVMNPFMEPPWQMALGPARTVGEAIACHNVCVHGLSKDPINGLNGKTVSLPRNWENYVIEFYNTVKDQYNASLEKAIHTNSQTLDFSNQTTIEQKCDEIFQKCLAMMKI